MNDRSPYQDRAIRNYYKNRGAIAEQRAQELVSELFLSSGKKRQRHWDNLVTHLKALGVPQGQIDRLRAADNPEMVAMVLKKL